ncbi:MAG: cyclic nucleotide binding protein [Deltaproteobacteria bacterium]|nr:cyclic nucleotide binding protein [Deltaproteobacteria bacterium]
MPADLEKILLFADFTEEELEKVRNISCKAKISQGEYAFHEDKPGDTLILLDLGTLKLTKKTKKGEDQELVQLGSGSYLGEMSLFDQRLRSASGLAMENCQLTIIPIAGLISLLDKNPPMAAKFYRRVAMGIAQRLKYMNEDFAALKTFLASGK